ncbi:MAG TPA: hypothetical protein VFG15_04515 [Amycolatopsis sp.]|nr:hypothetical protein [Amycolatopsis sp.]
MSLTKFLLISAPLLFVALFAGFKLLFGDTVVAALMNSLIIVAIFTVLMAIVDFVQKRTKRSS